MKGEVIGLSLKGLLPKKEPPCPKCPYRLGLVHTPVNPCRECKLDNYRMFEQFQKRVSGQ